MDSSDSNASGPAPAASGTSTESALLQALAKHLSNDEKAVRNREVVEQANKYFGGLDRRERRLLGMEEDDVTAVAKTEPVAKAALRESEYAEDEAAFGVERARHGSGYAGGVWARALLSVVAFAAVVYWVVFGK